MSRQREEHFDKIPPADMDAEKAVISCSLLDVAALEDAMAILKPEHFYADAHKMIWQGIVDVNASGTEVTAITLADRLRGEKKLDRVGGTPAIAAMLGDVPAVGRVETYATLVRSKWRRREFIAACQRALANAYTDNTDIDKQVMDHTLALDLVTEGRNLDTQALLKDVLRGETEAYDYRSQRKGYIPGIPTGLHDLDVRIGGLGRGNVYVVAGRPGMGKTGFMLSVAIEIARLGYGVIIISMEMPKSQLAQRVVAQLGHLDIKLIREGRLSAEDRKTFTACVAEASRLPIVIDDEAAQTPSSFRSAIRRAKRKLAKEFPEAKLGLIETDYLQLMTSDDQRDDAQEEVRKASRANAKAAKDHNVPVIALSQLNRKVEDRPNKRPNMGDLRQSGAIEQDAYGIFFLYREDKYRGRTEEMDGRGEIDVAKLRDGGSEGVVEAKFYGPSSKWHDKFNQVEERAIYDFD